MGCCVSSPAAVVDGEDAGRQTNKKVMKKESLDALSTETKNDALLALIPGRMFANGASNTACVFTQQGRKGTNQDAMVVWEGFATMEDTVFCGVFDGHGPYGHLVARRVRDSLPSKLVHYWQQELAARKESKEAQRQEGQNTAGQENFPTGAADDMGALGSEHGREPAIFGAWKESHLMAYRVMDKELFSHPSVDCFCSGTTTVTVLKQGQQLVIANVGDSRAILATKDENEVLKAIQLTVDLKPNLPKEAERIRQCRGRVFALHDEPEVPRVWLPFDDSPGLAMARAFGDFCLKDYGVIAVPELSYRLLTDKDQFIVLATDGIWDVLSNEEVVHVIASAPTRATAARALVESAVRVWRLKYPTSKVDDCAVVCLYLDHTVSTSGQLKTVDHSSPPCQPTHLKHQPLAEAPQMVPLNASGTKNTPVVGISKETTSSTQSIASASTAGRDPQTSGSGMGEITIGEAGDAAEKSKPHQQRSLAEWLGADEDEEWSALEGVTRVNSLLNLPRFSAGDKRLDGTPNDLHK
ncbi:unnamed protein product [Sphagnum balticum]